MKPLTAKSNQGFHFRFSYLEVSSLALRFGLTSSAGSGA
jgi:hypothetical protein